MEPLKRWSWDVRWACLEPAVASAVRLADPAARQAACHALGLVPRAGNTHVRFVPKLLTEDACHALREYLLTNKQAADSQRAGSGGLTNKATETAAPLAGAGEVGRSGQRRRWALSDGTLGAECSQWCAWFARAVLEPLAAALLAPAPAPPLLPPAAAALPDPTPPRFADHHGYVLWYSACTEAAAAAAAEGPPRNEATAVRFHTDDSDVTVNVCLGGDWEGGQLRFCDDLPGGQGRPGTPDPAEEHSEGRLWQVEQEARGCTMHDCCFHAAAPITRGERVQLIFWTMWNDAPWKEGFYGGLEAELAARYAAPAAPPPQS